MRKQYTIFSGIVLMVSVANASTITVTANGDPVSASCPATCSLRQAIAQANAGDTIEFAPSLTSPITLTQGELLINKALTISGPGAAALSINGQNVWRVFDIRATATITDLTVTDGAVMGATGSIGVNPGDSGGSGESVSGACVLVASGATAVLGGVAVRHCSATGGTGGNGVDGTPGMPPGPGGPGSAGGPGGAGGSGGTATGGAIQVYGSLSLIGSSVLDAHAMGGHGGNGANGGGGFIPGFIGQGGGGGPALGGAIAVGSGGSLRIFNSTVAASTASGGNGGTAGSSGTPPALGGIGGYATGGLLYVDGGAALADLEFSTLANGSVVGGTSGPLGPPNGVPSGNAINAASTLTVLSSVVVGAQGGVDLCYSPTSPNPITPVANSANLSETTNNSMFTSACNDFSLHATLADTVKPLDASAMPAFMPIWHSPAIDAAATCNDLLSQPVTIDQHDTPRPQGAKCDLGAIEADYLFVDGFGG